MTASAKTRVLRNPPLPIVKPQFITDEHGNKTAVVLSLETWERVASFLQNDIECALLSEPVQEDVSPRIAKKLRNHAKGKKEPMLTLEQFQAEVERLQKS